MNRRLMVWLNVAALVVVTSCGVWQLQHVADVKAQTNVQQAAAQAKKQIAKSADEPVAVKGIPMRLVIPRLVIDVQIRAGRYDAAQHTYLVDNDAADFIPGSVPITNTSGAAFIYGHDFNDILGKTRDIAAGDEAYIYTNNGHVLSYIFDDSKVVKPTDTSALNDLAGGQPRFKLMTCTGAWDQNRRIMTFTLKGAS